MRALATTATVFGNGLRCSRNSEKFRLSVFHDDSPPFVADFKVQLLVDFICAARRSGLAGCMIAAG
jgi:hypothetical protein